MNYATHLQKDSILATCLGNEVYTLQTQKNIALRLMQSIMSQQLNTKVAAIIFQRFLNVYGNKLPQLQQIIDTPSNTLKSIGLSNAKVQYVKNVALFCIEKKITDKKLTSLSNIEIIALLTQIKGVGRWTVEMLLMFSLGRADVFAVDDLGIQQAMIKLYELNIENKKILKEKMLAIANNWSPYQTYACLHLWHWKDVIAKNKK